MKPFDIHEIDNLDGLHPNKVQFLKRINEFCLRKELTAEYNLSDLYSTDDEFEEEAVDIGVNLRLANHIPMEKIDAEVDMRILDANSVVLLSLCVASDMVAIKPLDVGQKPICTINYTFFNWRKEPVEKLNLLLSNALILREVFLERNFDV